MTVLAYECMFLHLWAFESRVFWWWCIIQCSVHPKLESNVPVIRVCAREAVPSVLTNAEKPLIIRDPSPNCVSIPDAEPWTNEKSR